MTIGGCNARSQSFRASIGYSGFSGDYYSYMLRFMGILKYFYISLLLLGLSVVAHASFDLDIDDDGETEALTDGLLVIRHLFGFSGDSLTANATATDANRSDAASIETHLVDNKASLDIDGDGEVEALTDGLLIIRELFGFSGDSLITGAVSGSGTRVTADSVVDYLKTIKDTDNDGVLDSVDAFVTDAATLTTYCHGGFNKIYITNDNGVQTYEIAVQALGGSRTQVTGSINNDKLSLSGTVEEFSFNYEVVMAEDQSKIRLRIDARRGETSFLLNEYGTLGDCERYGGEMEDLPKLVKKDFTDVADFIEDISYFRSSAGHDYSDIFETCRSMKHYFSPIEEERKNATIPIYSPFDGTIVQLNTEESGGFVDDGTTNQRVVILSRENASIQAVIFHVDLQSADLVVGSSVEAGQQLGHARMESHRGVAHDFDIAIHVHAADGLRYRSYFDLLTDDIFSGYSGFGLYPSDFIITETQRNSDPLTCEGETFTTRGSLPSWIFNI